MHATQKRGSLGKIALARFQDVCLPQHRASVYLRIVLLIIRTSIITLIDRGKMTLRGGCAIRRPGIRVWPYTLGGAERTIQGDEDERELRHEDSALSGPAPGASPSARQVFDTTELLENILSHVSDGPGEGVSCLSASFCRLMFEHCS